MSRILIAAGRFSPARNSLGHTPSMKLHARLDIGFTVVVASSNTRKVLSVLTKAAVNAALERRAAELSTP